MKPNGRVKMIQQEREANRISLPFCHLRTEIVTSARYPHIVRQMHIIFSFLLVRVIDRSI